VEPLAGRLEVSSGVAVEKRPASMVDMGEGRKEKAHRIGASQGAQGGRGPRRGAGYGEGRDSCSHGR